MTDSVRIAGEAMPVLAPFSKNNGIEAHLGIGGKFVDIGDANVADANLNKLYQTLKMWWQDQPAADGQQLIRQLKMFAADDGSRPYQDMQTHTSVLTRLMHLLKEEGGSDTAQYAMLSDGLCLAVVSNGFYTQFMSKMMERPDAPEVW